MQRIIQLGAVALAASTLLTACENTSTATDPVVRDRDTNRAATVTGPTPPPQGGRWEHLRGQ